jgi:hypothetical protein
MTPGLASSPIRPLLPPRPNLGPEPLSSPWPSADAGLAVIAGVILLALLMVWLVRRHWRRPASPVPSLAISDEPLTPRQRLIQTADRLRAALVARFGPSWAAKTTEEIATEPALADLLGAERLAPLLELLRAADRAKFASEPQLPDPGLQPPTPNHDWVDKLLAVLTAAAAGANSRIKGK